MCEFKGNITGGTWMVLKGNLDLGIPKRKKLLESHSIEMSSFEKFEEQVKELFSVKAGWQTMEKKSSIQRKNIYKEGCKNGIDLVKMALNFITKASNAFDALNSVGYSKNPLKKEMIKAPPPIAFVSVAVKWLKSSKQNIFSIEVNKKCLESAKKTTGLGEYFVVFLNRWFNS